MAFSRHCESVIFLLFFEHKELRFLNETKQPSKYADSYDNEYFAPQNWGDDENCIVITTLTHQKEELGTV